MKDILILLVWQCGRMSHMKNAEVMILQFSGVKKFLTTVEGSTSPQDFMADAVQLIIF